MLAALCQGEPCSCNCSLTAEAALTLPFLHVLSSTELLAQARARSRCFCGAAGPSHALLPKRQYELT